jgi:hypothetical protein
MHEFGTHMSRMFLFVGTVRSVPQRPCIVPALDDALIGLSIKLGGLGILSYKTCAPLAYAAASEASDTLLAPVLDQDIDTANRTVLSQRERCQEAFLATRDSLLRVLGPAERQIGHIIVFSASFSSKSFNYSLRYRSHGHFPPRVRAVEPKRPILTCLVAVGAPPRRLRSPLAPVLDSRLRIPFQAFLDPSSSIEGRDRSHLWHGQEIEQSVIGRFERKLSASLAAAAQNAAAVAAESDLKAVGRCASERRRS